MSNIHDSRFMMISLILVGSGSIKSYMAQKLLSAHSFHARQLNFGLKVKWVDEVTPELF